MNETMTPTDAARVLAEASGYEDALVQRTEGLTVMVWGLVTPGIWLAYAGFGTRPIAPFLWVPWVAAGAVTTFFLWRSAALSQPGALGRQPGLAFFARWLGFVIVLAASMYIVRPNSAAGPLVIVGLSWLAMAAFNLWGMSPRGRGVWLVCGSALVLSGGALLLLRAGEDVGLTVSVLVSGIVPLAAGAYQTTRG